MALAIVVGTRPEIVKMAPIILALEERGVAHALIHTGQHYDREMSQIFLEELGLPAPDTFLDVRSGTHAEQTAEALVELESAFLTLEPKLILVQGDTNAALAAALAGAKLGIDVGHVEAGLRSHDLRMPEEHNRRLVDHLSTYLFAPTDTSAENLRRESVWGEILVTGNTVIDACLHYLPIAEARSTVLDTLDFEPYALATAHRAENVDHAAILSEIVRILTEAPLPIVYPIHPRTKRRLLDFGLHSTLAESDNVQLIPPQGYLDFLALMKHASFLLTDSGGLQEEATAPNLQKKVFVLRESTERPEAVDSGHAEVLGTQAEPVLDRLRAYALEPDLPVRPSPYGDGTSGAAIADIVQGVLRGRPSPPPMQVTVR